MLNIHDLEKQWLKYKLKSYIPYFILISISIAALSFLTFFDFAIPTKVISKHDIDRNTSVMKTENPIKETAKNKVTDTIVEVKNEEPIDTLVLNKKIPITPSLGFLENIKNTPTSISIQKDSSPKKILTPKIKEIVLDTKVETPTSPTSPIKAPVALKNNVKIPEVLSSKVLVPEVEEKVMNTQQTTEIKIKRQNTLEDIQHVIKRFKNSNNPALSLFIAKKYYEIQNYNQAYNYALMTNELNNDIEDSWIIFAKSLFKMGKKDKAMEVLKKYILTSHSHQAKITLDSMRSGDVK